MFERLWSLLRGFWRRRDDFEAEEEFPDALFGTPERVERCEVEDCVCRRIWEAHQEARKIARDV
jgi:hypothetical protein